MIWHHPTSFTSVANVTGWVTSRHAGPSVDAGMGDAAPGRRVVDVAVQRHEGLHRGGGPGRRGGRRPRRHRAARQAEGRHEHGQAAQSRSTPGDDRQHQHHRLPRPTPSTGPVPSGRPGELARRTPRGERSPHRTQRAGRRWPPPEPSARGNRGAGDGPRTFSAGRASETVMDPSAAARGSDRHGRSGPVARGELPVLSSARRASSWATEPTPRRPCRRRSSGPGGSGPRSAPGPA